MILYENRDSRFSGYAQRYSENENLFPISQPYFDFADNLMRLVSRGSSINILEIGCGQGYYAQHCYEFLQDLLKKNDSLGEISNFIALDAAWTAIQQAEQRFSPISWVCDSIENFLDNINNNPSLNGIKFDLIIDKGGSTFIKTERDAINIQGKLRSVLKPSGVYTYIISRSFHNTKGKDVIYKDWSLDWIDLGKKIFVNNIDCSDSYIYKVMYIK